MQDHTLQEVFYLNKLIKVERNKLLLIYVDSTTRNVR